MSYSVAMLSVHTSPLAAPGSTPDAGGMNVYIRELARQLGQSQLTVDIFTRRTNESDPSIVQLTPYVRVIHITAGPAAPVPKNDLYQYLPAFAQHVEDFRRAELGQYDLLHSHYWLSGVVALSLAQRWDVPHVTMFHTLAHLKQLANPDSPESPLRLEMEHQLIQHADCIIATTQDERAQIIRHCGAPASQVKVIPCGVDLQRFVHHERASVRAELGLKQNTPILLFVGRLDPFKGPDLLLRAAAMMQTKAHVLIVGGKSSGDPELQSLRRLAAELGMQRRAHFLGARPQAELPAIYSAADITVMPSYHESFGLAAVESLACSTPVVATRAGGLTTVVRHGETGYLVPRCAGFFAQHLDCLLQQPDTLNAMRRAARPSVLQYNWENVARQVRGVYHSAMAETRQLAAQ